MIFDYVIGGKSLLETRQLSRSNSAGEGRRLPLAQPTDWAVILECPEHFLAK
jgi:hypothetical protein